MMGIKDRLNDFFFLDEDSEEVEEVVEQKNSHQKVNEKPAPRVEKKVVEKEQSGIQSQPIRKSTAVQNVVALNQQQGIKKPRINVIEPRTYSEVQSVADILLSNQTVIMNFRRMEKDQAKKVIDYLMGATYAIKGDIQRIGDEIFVCTPSSVELDGAELQALKKQDF